MPRGGLRPGSGRKKGAGTIAREAARAAMEMALARHSAELVAAQLRITLGQHVLYRRADSHPIRVTSKAEIARYMAGEVDRAQYLDIVAERPNGPMIANLLNRLFGTPRQTIDIPDQPYRPLFALPDARMISIVPVERDEKSKAIEAALHVVRRGLAHFF